MYPCDDELMVSSVGDPEIHNLEHNGHEHENGVDYCSPFCVCAITHVVEFEPTLIKANLLANFDNSTFEYLDPYSKEMTSKVFLPPQV